MEKDPISQSLQITYDKNVDDDHEVDPDLINEIMNLPIVEADGYVNSDDPDYKQNVTDDYSFIRNTLILSIEEAQRSLKDARVLARIAPNPKAYEAIAKLLKIISDNTEKLFNLHKGIRDSIKDEKPQNEDSKGGIKNVEGNVIVASTEDVLKMINQKNDPS